MSINYLIKKRNIDKFIMFIMDKNLKRSYENWIRFLKGTVLLVSGIIVILAFMALFLI